MPSLAQGPVDAVLPQPRGLGTQNRITASPAPAHLPHPQWPSVPGSVVTAHLGSLMSDVGICSQQHLFASDVKGTLRVNVCCHCSG